MVVVITSESSTFHICRHGYDLGVGNCLSTHLGGVSVLGAVWFINQ